MRATRLLAAMLVLSVSCPAAAELRVPRSLASLKPEHVQSAAEIAADPLEPNVEISTRRAHRKREKAVGTLSSDAYLVAILDKQSGTVRSELRNDILYSGPRRDFEAVHYLDAGQLRRAPLSQTRDGADQCPNSDFNGDCFLRKTVTIPLEEPLLRRIAALAEASWQFRLKEKRGEDVTAVIVPAEADGLLRAVAAYRGEAGVLAGGGKGR